MLSKCANPECETQLHYLRDGKLFGIERKSPFLVDGRKPVSRIEHFWLCGPCSQHSTLLYDKVEGLRIVAKTIPTLRKHAAAS